MKFVCVTYFWEKRELTSRVRFPFGTKCCETMETNKTNKQTKYRNHLTIHSKDKKDNNYNSNNSNSSSSNNNNNNNNNNSSEKQRFIKASVLYWLAFCIHFSSISYPIETPTPHPEGSWKAIKQSPLPLPLSTLAIPAVFKTRQLRDCFYKMTSFPVTYNKP